MIIKIKFNSNNPTIKIIKTVTHNVAMINFYKCVVLYTKTTAYSSEYKILTYGYINKDIFKLKYTIDGERI